MLELSGGNLSILLSGRDMTSRTILGSLKGIWRMHPLKFRSSTSAIPKPLDESPLQYFLHFLGNSMTTLPFPLKHTQIGNKVYGIMDASIVHLRVMHP